LSHFEFNVHNIFLVIYSFRNVSSQETSLTSEQRSQRKAEVRDDAFLYARSL